MPAKIKILIGILAVGIISAGGWKVWNSQIEIKEVINEFTIKEK